jgi:hypothetical protein
VIQRTAGFKERNMLSLFRRTLIVAFGSLLLVPAVSSGQSVPFGGFSQAGSFRTESGFLGIPFNRSTGSFAESTQLFGSGLYGSALLGSNFGGATFGNPALGGFAVGNALPFSGFSGMSGQFNQTVGGTGLNPNFGLQGPGTFTPGFGVEGNLGFPVAGGFYLPGFGVVGSTAVPVQGGIYRPGYGVNMGFPTHMQVVGGTYVPGYGVNMGFPTASVVQGGALIPGFGVMNPGPLFPGAIPGAVVPGSFGSGVSSGFGNGGFTPTVGGGSLVPGFGVVGGR